MVKGRKKKMTDWRYLASIRRDYGNLALDEQSLADNPFDQFKAWFEESYSSERSDPSAMMLSTVDEQGFPDARIVLLKGIEDDAFVFFTNYQSKKGQQLQKKPYAALTFYWPELSRQIRIRGVVKRSSSAQSDAYFKQRPLNSQLSAIASPQSEIIANRQYLEKRYHDLLTDYPNDSLVERPKHWGGYLLVPQEFEFWQGRDNRLHDRIFYAKQQDTWIHHRLAP